MSSSSITSLQTALVAMKERCQRLQKRVEVLERENILMTEVRTDLYNEVKRLHETNVKLREKNLQMNNELREGNPDKGWLNLNMSSSRTILFIRWPNF